jgi:hypothetical protein
LKGEWTKESADYYWDADYGGVTRGYEDIRGQTVEKERWFAWEPDVCHCLDCQYNEGLPKSFSTAIEAMKYLESRYNY